MRKQYAYSAVSQTCARNARALAIPTYTQSLTSTKLSIEFVSVLRCAKTNANLSLTAIQRLYAWLWLFYYYYFFFFLSGKCKQWRNRDEGAAIFVKPSLSSFENLFRTLVLRGTSEWFIYIYIDSLNIHTHSQTQETCAIRAHRHISDWPRKMLRRWIGQNINDWYEKHRTFPIGN